MKITINRFLVARPTIQCIDPRDKLIGCWLYSGSTHKDPTAALSPRFDTSLDLIHWCHKNGWVSYGDTYLYEP